MAVRFTRSRGRLGAQRRETLWTPIPLAVSVITGDGVALVASATAAEDALRPYTIIRTHLHVDIVSDQRSADEQQFIAVGMASVSDQAVSIGVSAVPTPVTDLASDAWYVHQWVTANFVFLTGIGFTSPSSRVIDIDSKAMRKVEDGFSNILVLEAQTLSEGAFVTTCGRQFFKLH